MICPCSLANNNSKLSANLSHITDKRLSSVTFSASDITKIFQNLSSNIAHGHDNISIKMWMLKICGDTVNKPLELIFKRHGLITVTYPFD